MQPETRTQPVMGRTAVYKLTVLVRDINSFTVQVNKCSHRSTTVATIKQHRLLPTVAAANHTTAHKENIPNPLLLLTAPFDCS